MPTPNTWLRDAGFRAIELISVASDGTQGDGTSGTTGISATRIALTAHGKMLSFDDVAKMLGTTTNGTNSAVDVTRVLNSQLGKGPYVDQARATDPRATPSETR